MAANSKEVIQVEVEQRDLGTQLELDPSTLDPAYVYRWVRKVPLKMARQKVKGYEIVVPADDEGIRNVFGDSPEAEDGTYTMGDVVLMRCKKQSHKARRHAVKRRTDQRLRGPEKKFRRESDEIAQKRGIDIEVITDKE